MERRTLYIGSSWIFSRRRPSHPCSCARTGEAGHLNETDMNVSKKSKCAGIDRETNLRRFTRSKIGLGIVVEYRISDILGVRKI